MRKPVRLSTLVLVAMFALLSFQFDVAAQRRSNASTVSSIGLPKEPPKEQPRQPPKGLPAAPTAGSLIISEFRLRGPNGANDEFIEIYNDSGADHTVTASSGTGYAIAASDGVVRCTIPNGTIIPARGRSEEHTSELQSRLHLVCRLLLEKKKKKKKHNRMKEHTSRKVSTSESELSVSN